MAPPHWGYMMGENVPALKGSKAVSDSNKEGRIQVKTWREVILLTEIL